MGGRKCRLMDTEASPGTVPEEAGVMLGTVAEEHEELLSRKPQTLQKAAGDSEHMWVPRRKCRPSV